jgi:hypothetical protein
MRLSYRDSSCSISVFNYMAGSIGSVHIELVDGEAILKLVCGAFCGVVVFLISGSARADHIAPCSAPEGMTSESIPSAIPPALQAKLGKIATPGAAFDATDIIVTGLSRRYIFVWHRENRWIVATEHGGRGYNDPIMAYELSTDGNVATLVRQLISGPSTVCSDAVAMAKG